MSKHSGSSAIDIPKKAFDTVHSANVVISQSFGGTIYGTTPGGTKFVYDRQTLLNLRMSPLSKTPPVGMANVSCVTRNTPPAAFVAAAAAATPTKVSPSLNPLVSPTVRAEGGQVEVGVFSMDS
eukprot:TRINITY_DN3494_c0_g1_i1.p1 TRINITY_DN3494_c0_g1~~TRINITY_DN3494_c0_g1_i1.p1  ORF type:complete len:124 (+),score=30.02 TRINITY_DN3494_c0_g1_i1:234-605(+)